MRRRLKYAFLGVFVWLLVLAFTAKSDAAGPPSGAFHDYVSRVAGVDCPVLGDCYVQAPDCPSSFDCRLDSAVVFSSDATSQVTLYAPDPDPAGSALGRYSAAGLWLLGSQHAVGRCSALADGESCTVSFYGYRLPVQGDDLTQFQGVILALSAVAVVLLAVIFLTLVL